MQTLTEPNGQAQDALADVANSLPGSVRKRPGKKRSLRQAVELQTLVYQRAKDRDLKANDLASLARAWDILEERMRILKGQPLPGSMKPVAKPQKQRATGSSMLIDVVGGGQDE